MCTAAATWGLTTGKCQCLYDIECRHPLTHAAVTLYTLLPDHTPSSGEKRRKKNRWWGQNRKCKANTCAICLIDGHKPAGSCLCCTSVLFSACMFVFVAERKRERERAMAGSVSKNILCIFFSDLIWKFLHTLLPCDDDDWNQEGHFWSLFYFSSFVIQLRH